MLIRVASTEGLPLLQEIEVEAGEPFADVAMPEVARYQPPEIHELQAYVDAGLAWLAADERDRPIAYLLAQPVDGCLHIAQVSVRPTHARRGLGRALIEHAAGVAKAQAYPALTLTTFTEVPWNGPYYQRLGFRYLAGPEITPGLAAIRAHERELGLDRWPRACMRRDVHGGETTTT